LGAIPTKIPIFLEFPMKSDRAEVVSTISSTVGVIGAGTALLGAVLASIPLLSAAAVMGIAALVASNAGGKSSSEVVQNAHRSPAVTAHR
jgi:hypothetical protein